MIQTVVDPRATQYEVLVALWREKQRGKSRRVRLASDLAWILRHSLVVGFGLDSR